MNERVEVDLGEKSLIIETGKVAKQAHGATIVRLGDTMILATVVEAKEVDEEQDFFPLFVDYREKTYAAGKIPGTPGSIDSVNDVLDKGILYIYTHVTKLLGYAGANYFKATGR